MVSTIHYSLFYIYYILFYQIILYTLGFIGIRTFTVTYDYINEI